MEPDYIGGIAPGFPWNMCPYLLNIASCRAPARAGSGFPEDLHPSAEATPRHAEAAPD